MNESEGKAKHQSKTRGERKKQNILHLIRTVLIQILTHIPQNLIRIRTLIQILNQTRVLQVIPVTGGIGRGRGPQREGSIIMGREKRMGEKKGKELNGIKE